MLYLRGMRKTVTLANTRHLVPIDVKTEQTISFCFFFLHLQFFFLFSHRSSSSVFFFLLVLLSLLLLVTFTSNALVHTDECNVWKIIINDKAFCFQKKKNDNVVACCCGIICLILSWFFLTWNCSSFVVDVTHRSFVRWLSRHCGKKRLIHTYIHTQCGNRFLPSDHVRAMQNDGK